MKVLVIGGSYFLGKCFVELAMKEHVITVFNRGSRSLGLAAVKEIQGDRKKIQDLLKLKTDTYDVVVDFCAYTKGDIRQIFEAVGGIKQYIFISTCDVYERGTGKCLSEDAPFETRDFGGEAGSYILGKAALEEELIVCGQKYNVGYTSLRPVFVYGPDNYAPREGMYFRWIDQAGQILHPVDATGEFQMVYVEDVAKAILNSIGNDKAYNQAFNITSNTIETYDSFADALSFAVKKPFERVSVTVDMVNEKGIPLPFPLTLAESNRYEGTKSEVLIEAYTPLKEGLKKTVYKP